MTHKAKYYDGKRPLSIPVTWEIKDDFLIIHIVETGTRLPSWELKHCRQDVDQNTVFVLKNLLTGESLEFEGEPVGLPAHLIQEESVKFNGKIFASIVAGLVLVLSLYWLALPHMTKFAASHVPPEYEKKISDSLFKELRGIQVCKPEPEAKAALNKLIKRIYPIDLNEKPEDLNIDIVKSDPPMENAFTLPGGRIILFRDLVKNAKSPEELAGVLAHEIGHAKNRHILQKLIQALGLAAMFQFIGGDFSSALALDPATVLSLGSLSFDRGMEHEADQFALERMTETKVDPSHMAGFFKRLPDLGMAIVSTHPGHKERIERFTKKIDFKPEPLLTDKEWRALKAYCDPALKPVKLLLKLRHDPPKKKAKKNDSLPPAPRDDLRQRFQFPQRF